MKYNGKKIHKANRKVLQKLLFSQKHKCLFWNDDDEEPVVASLVYIDKKCSTKNHPFLAVNRIWVDDDEMDEKTTTSSWYQYCALLP